MNRFFTQKKLALLGFCLLILGQYSSFAQTCEAVVWSDEFDINGAPNPENWSYDLGKGDNGWGNGEVQSYTDNSNNIRISNGNLIIEAKKTGAEWTSARIKTQGKKNWLYGRIEFRAKLPTGGGTWPALWMLGESISSISWPACGEIDIMEHIGNDQNKIHGSLHTPSSFGATVNSGTKVISTASTEFHTYAADWDQDKIVFSIDGISYYTYNPSVKNADTWPFYNKADFDPTLDDKFFIIINLAMGGAFGGNINENLSAAVMEVDYVRVYQEIDQIEILGERIIEPGQSDVKFRTNKIEGAIYNWTIPAGTTIVSGAGTNEITINWGATSGKILVRVQSECATFNAELDVLTTVNPEGDVFVLDHFDDNNYDRWASPEPPNEFTYTETGSELRIDYNITDPSTLPIATFNFPDIINMESYSQLNISLKTFNESRSVVVRADLFDTEGIATTASPIFKLEPLIDDGDYFTYRFDFNNNWGSSSNTEDVDAKKIAGLQLYINYGAFSVVDQDSVWLESVTITQPSSEATAPLRPSHLSGEIHSASIQIAWQDNSDDETAFVLYRSEEKNSGYQIIKEDLTAETTEYTDNSITTGIDYYYKVLAKNGIGDSDFSNVSVLEEAVVANLFDDSLVRNIKIFPNPATNQVTVEWIDNGNQLTEGTIEFINCLGQSIIQSSMFKNKELTLDLSQLNTGIYFIVLSSRGELITKKMIRN